MQLNRVLLVLAENLPDVTGYFLTTRTVNELSVDTSRGEQLQINVRLFVTTIECPQLQRRLPICCFDTAL